MLRCLGYKRQVDLLPEVNLRSMATERGSLRAYVWVGLSVLQLGPLMESLLEREKEVYWAGWSASAAAKTGHHSVQDGKAQFGKEKVDLPWTG